MGELINLEEYRTAKQAGVTVEVLRRDRETARRILEELETGIEREYVQATENDNVLKGYEYILQEDVSHHLFCSHDSWSVVEEGYQAMCDICGLNAWSAPW